MNGLLREEFGRRTVHEVVSGERDEIMKRVTDRVADDARKIGVEIVDVRLKRVDLPTGGERRRLPRAWNRSESASPPSCARPARPRPRGFAPRPKSSAR
ncbi:MAG: SPFH domain-containing protein [Burkholderiales bacterium]|nr:SPFH domain-containing protein [Burkholderiales bacterium]